MSDGEGVSARFYFDDRAGILGYFITADKAARVFAEHACDGDLPRGFSYWASGAGITRLVPVRVTPVSAAEVPASVRAALERGVDSVLMPDWREPGPVSSWSLGAGGGVGS